MRSIRISDRNKILSVNSKVCFLVSDQGVIRYVFENASDEFPAQAFVRIVLGLPFYRSPNRADRMKDENFRFGDSMATSWSLEAINQGDCLMVEWIFARAML